MYRKLICLVVVVLMANCALGSTGQNNWTGGTSTDYMTGSNWDTGSVPMSWYVGSNEQIEGGGYSDDLPTGSLPITTPTYWPVLSSEAPMIREFKIAHDDVAGIYGQFTINTGGSLFLSGDLEVGNGEAGTIDVDMPVGILYMNGGYLHVGDDFRVGRRGQGTIEMTGGYIHSTDRAENLDMGDARGIVNISGGTIDWGGGIAWGSNGSVINMSGTGLLKMDSGRMSVASAQALIDAEGFITGDVMAWAGGDGYTYVGVPEPATLALLGLGGFLLRRRRR